MYIYLCIYLVKCIYLFFSLYIFGSLGRVCSARSCMLVLLRHSHVKIVKSKQREVHLRAQQGRLRPVMTGRWRQGCEAGTAHRRHVPAVWRALQCFIHLQQLVSVRKGFHMSQQRINLFICTCNSLLSSFMY